MATSSRQSALFGPNDWKTIYQTFREADFKSYDYETLRKSFIDYLQLYYPETFNDYTESSEFIALLDLMAFMGQGLAYRNDLNARENFLDTAERRDSVIKLANLVSYTPKRNLAGQGYLKVISVRTSQNVTDINGTNLSNLVITWNDPANANWLEQFNTVMNAALINTQRIGRPGNSQDILGVTTQEYTFTTPTNSIPVYPFTTVIDNQSMNFELVSVTSVDSDTLYEIPPAPTNRFNILYRNDKLGYGSPETGFFFYFKQGTLQSVDFTLEQQISNQTVDIGVNGVNNTDTWLFQINNTITDRTLWRKVDNIYADAYLQTESSDRKIFSVNSRANDQVTYVFGDGVFSEIPVGTFRAYVRGSNGLSYSIEPSEMQNISISVPYISRQGKTENLIFELELTSVVNNAQEREPLTQIKQRAPTRYYTQNRMVNGEDYNNFPYTLYSSIIKSKALNRSSVGVSKNLDLLDPTLKYSSTNSFGSDGALYKDDTDSFFTLTINNINDIIAFLTSTLSSALNSNKAIQYYTEYYPRYLLSPNPGDPLVYWKTSTIDANSGTGYFYTVSGSNETPISVGIYSSNNAKYITPGANCFFTAPSGYYFDDNNRLVSGIPGPTNKTYIWSTVLRVLNDGSNSGEGAAPSGLGPITLNGNVPEGCILTQIIPVFDNSLSQEIIDECVIRMELNQNFTLIFNNSLPINLNRWSVGLYEDPNYFVKFTSLGNNRYTILYRSLTYYFGSVSDTRFTLSPNELVYDPFSGKILQDFIGVLGTNSQPFSSYPLGRNIQANILGQTIQSDGYINDFEVEVAATDVNNRQYILNPDYFYEITGYTNGAANFGLYVFFETIQNAITLSSKQIVPSSQVEYQYSNKSSIENVKYEYPVGQLFYAYLEDIFYKTMQDPAVVTPYLVLVEQPQYSMKPGRQGLSFQYRHNSNNTTRIDPVTTNIIDLYVVTQSYYTAYQNWIQDSTNTVPQPDRPTINELNQQYSQVNNYKMLSDAVIMNSVVFKPLFGPKAQPALRGTIKVVKAGKSSASDSEIRSAVLTAMNSYFDINNWNFGDTFFFSELSAYLHAECGELISSAVLVSNDPNKPFGDLYEIKCMPYEIFVNAATATDVQVVAALTPFELQISTRNG